MEANTRYLTLALDIRSITDSLIEFVEESKELPESNELLGTFLKSLNERTGASVRALSDMGRFGEYESLRTINEIFDSRMKKDLMNKLHEVQDQESETRKDAALEAIELLDSLERAALYRYEHPGPRGRLAFAQ